MTQRNLLDANALFRLIPDPRGPVATRLAQVGESNVLTSIDVAPLETRVDLV